MAAQPGNPDHKEDAMQTVSPPYDILKQGKLMKQGAGLFGSMSWKDRYFILKSNGLFEYYEDNKYSNLKGSIEVDKIYKTQRKDNKNFLLLTKERTWHLYSQTPSELDEWQRLLTQMTKREDAITFTVQSADFAAVIGTGVQNSNMFGFVGDGLTVSLIGSANVFNKVTFSSFNYQPVIHDINVKGNTVINLNNYITQIQLNGSHSYHIDLEKKSLEHNTSLSEAIKTRNIQYPIIRHDFQDQPEYKQSLNDNDIFVNMNLQCNYHLNAQQSMALIGTQNEGLFKKDTRKLQVNVLINGTASIRPKYTILQKNDSTSYPLWMEYCTQLLNKELENKMRQIRSRKNTLINSGNRFHLLPHVIRTQFPLKKYYTLPISHRVLNKKCLCHVENIHINKYGEILNDTVYVMAEIKAVDEKIHRYPRMLLDTIHVDAQNRIMHKHHKGLVRDLFQNGHSIPWHTHFGHHDGRLTHLGRRLIEHSCHHTHGPVNGPVRIELSRATPSQHQQGIAYVVKVYAEKTEKRYFYKIETRVSRVDESEQILNDNVPSFTAPYMFGKTHTVVIQHRGGGNGRDFTTFLRVKPKALQNADAHGGQGVFAQWEALPQDGGSKIKLRSVKSGRYLRIHNNNVDVGGSGGKFTVFWVHQEHDGTVQLESDVERGRYIAVGKNNVVRIGTGGPWCNLQMFAKQEDCIIL